MDLSNVSPALVLVTVIGLALAPFVAVMVTSFTKIIVVLSLLRSALGLQQTPPNVVLNGLAIILSFYVMHPVVLKVTDALAKAPPAAASAASSSDVNRMVAMFDVAKEPVREFLVKYTTPKERAFFLRTARASLPEDQRARVNEKDFVILIPAFTVSELTAAFQIGFLIFLPFLIIDMVVSNILMAMGMMMLSPNTIALPFKLLLFVLLDGWAKIVHGLVLTY
jgi:type III secretion protein R